MTKRQKANKVACLRIELYAARAISVVSQPFIFLCDVVALCAAFEARKIQSLGRVSVTCFAQRRRFPSHNNYTVIRGEAGFRCSSDPPEH